MSTIPSFQLHPITNSDLLMFRFAKSKNLSYLRCRDSRCKQNVYKIHDNNFKSKIGEHLSICRFSQQQHLQLIEKPKEEPKVEPSSPITETYLQGKRKLSESFSNWVHEHSSTSNESKHQVNKNKNTKVEVIEIRDVASSVNNSSSFEIDIDDCINDNKCKDVSFENNKSNCDNNLAYEKMFTHFVSFMEMFFKYYNQKKSKEYTNEDSEIESKKKSSEIGEVDINN